MAYNRYKYRGEKDSNGKPHGKGEMKYIILDKSGEYSIDEYTGYFVVVKGKASDLLYMIMEVSIQEALFG